LILTYTKEIKSMIYENLTNLIKDIIIGKPRRRVSWQKLFNNQAVEV